MYSLPARGGPKAGRSNTGVFGKSKNPDIRQVIRKDAA